MDTTAWLAKAREAIALDVKALRDIKVLLHDNYAYFTTPLAPVQMAMMAEDLLPYPVGDIEMAMREWRVCGPPPGHKPRPPMPSDLIRIMRPTIDENAKANAFAATILRCVSKFGYTSPARAQDYMGPVAWQVVKMRGTWADLCRTVTVDNFSSVHAQLRDSAKAVISQGRAVMPHNRSLPSSETVAFGKAHGRRLSSISEVLSEAGLLPEEASP